MGISIISKAVPLQQLIETAYTFSEPLKKTQSHLFSFWTLCSNSQEPRSEPSFKCVNSPIQFYSDQSYVVLHICNSSLTVSSQMPIFLAETLFTMNSLNQAYVSYQTATFSNEPRIFKYKSSSNSKHNQKQQKQHQQNDTQHTQRQLLQVGLHVWTGHYVDIVDKCISISIARKLQEYLRRGCGHPARQMFNQGTQWKPGFFKSLSNSNQLKQGKNIKITDKQYQHIWKFRLFSEILFPDHKPHNKKLCDFIKKQSKIGATDQYLYPLRRAHKEELEQKQKDSQINSPRRQHQNQPSMSKPFICQYSVINPRTNLPTKTQLPQQQSELLYNALDLSANCQPILRAVPSEPHLFLGPPALSKDLSTLQKHNIKLIINCAADVCRNWFLEDISYKWFFMKDSQEENIEAIVYQTVDSIKQVQREGAGVFVHCDAERRSCALMIGIVMVKSMVGFDEAYNRLKAVAGNVEICKGFEQQLRLLETRKNKIANKNSSKGFIVGSYQKQNPSHLVAKYIGTFQNDNQLLGLTNFDKNVYIQKGEQSIKIFVNKGCAYGEQYRKFAEQYAKLLQKYESSPSAIIIQQDKKPPSPIQATVQTFMPKVWALNPSSPSKPAGYKSPEILTFKYPLLRPIFQPRREDGYYFVIKEVDNGARVNMIKGKEWIGYEDDKDQFFDRIVKVYLTHVSHQRIWVEEEAENSHFDTSLIQ